MVPRRRAHRAAHPGLRPLERGDDGRQGEQARRRHRRPPLDVRQLGEPLRDRLQPLLPRQGRRQRRRRRLLPGPRRPRHLRQGVHGGPPDRRRPRPLPPGDRPRRPRPVELPAPPPDARLLGVPDGRRWASARSRALYHARFNRYLQNRQIDDTSQTRVWCFMGDGEIDEPESLGAITHRHPRAARQPDLRHQLQPAAPRRPGARQRQGHPGAGGRLPRRRLERHQGHLGLEVGRAAGPGQGRRAAQPDEHDRRRRVPALLGRVRRVHPRQLLRPRPAPAGDGRPPHRRRAAQPAPRRPRLPQAVRRLQGGDGEPRQRVADGDPGQDDQGLDARRGLRGPQRHPPDQEDDQGPARRPARPAVPARRDPRGLDPRRRPAVLRPAGGLRRVPVHDGAPPGARRLDAQAHDEGPPPARAADRQAVRRAPRRLRATKRCRRRWASPGCCATSPATSTSARGSCRSSPTRPARSAWTPCSAS